MERLLDDLLAGDLLGLLEEDVGDAGRVRGGVEAAAALLRELGQERVRAAACADRREGDPVGLHLGEDRVVLAGGGPAVGQQDDVAAGRGRPLERLHGLVEAGEDVRLAERLDPGDRPARSAIPPSGWVWTTQWALSSKATIPSWSRADIAAAARRIASLPMSTLRTPAIPPPPAPRSNVLQWQASIEPGLVDDDDERDVGLLLAVLDAHVDRERLLDRGVGVAARAVALRAADHHEAPAEVADVLLERGQLAGREAEPRDVDEDDAVVREEALDPARELLGDRACRPAGARSSAPRRAPRQRLRRRPGRGPVARP